jgi:CPA2 family monovalent cation:H+ antiporter-2
MGIAADFVLIVLAGFCGAVLARVLRLPLLVGYVAAGVAVGPYTGGPTVGQIHDLELLAEIGVALLLFSLGLEVSIRDLKPVRKIALIGGPIQVLLTAAVAALAGARLFGMPFTESLWFGSMVSLSSTMVVLKTLSAAGVTNSLASRVMIGMLVIQDLAVIPILIVLPQLGDLDNALPKLAKALGIAAVFLTAIVVVGTRLLPAILKRVLAWGSSELFLVAVVAIGVGLGYAAHMAGLSFALGAFVAGVVLSESEFSHQALSDVVPLRDIFGLLFFVTVGMLFDPAFVVQHVTQICVAVAAIFIGKALIFGTIARSFGYVKMAPWIIGLGLSQIGEFSFVLARSGLTAGAVSRDTYNLALTCTIVTMALSPVVSSLALPLGRVWQRVRKPAAAARSMELPPTELRDHVIVAGYGRSGRAAARALRASGLPLLVVESNYALYGDAVHEGLPAVWGDITRGPILHAAAVDKARMLLLAVPDKNTVLQSVEGGRRINPNLLVIARAARDRHVNELRKRGIDVAIQPEFEGGVEMVRQALILYPYDEAKSAELVSALRQDLYRYDKDPAS